MSYKEKIQKSGLKIKWIAEQIGISSVLLSYYLNGTRPMPEHIQKKLTYILG